jgi:hypothetical protein
VPQSEQRYDSLGDYFWDEKDPDLLHVKISRFEDWRMCWLVMHHELSEYGMCLHEGILESDIMAFDVEFESRRLPGNDDEPGDDPKAPYRKQHLIAEGLEKVLAAEMGVDWKAYGQACLDLFPEESGHPVTETPSTEPPIA